MGFLALLFITLYISPAFSTSRNALLEEKNLQKGFQITLKHVDSDGNFTKFERLQRAMKRGKKRLHMLTVFTASTDSTSDVKSPIYPGNGEFLMQLSVGTPLVSYSAIMDTGSDLIWTQCKPCKQCFDQSTPIFDPKKSSSFSSLPCSSNLCEALPASSCGTNGCEYLYTYGDYSSTQGIMAYETFTFGNVSIPNVGFGCGEDNEGSGFSQGGGLVGLGRGPLSLVSQLDEPKFSYCLTSIDDTKSSKLLMGSLPNLDTSKSSTKTTPLFKNPSNPSFYYLDLEGITIGDTLLPIKESTFKINDDGSGGMIIDSGTTITYLEKSAFDLVKKEFISHVKLPVDDSGSTGLDLCFTLPSSNTNDINIEVPKLIFHFKGLDVDLPGENYIIADSSLGVACLAMGSSSGMSIFGNVQQQNLLVLYDLEKETMSFIPTDCSEL
ncbi:hypothetical protein M9H77_12655 [Catharanthus roseus]|uniref:Uncharacterized protein n=1 Tax=Catharanthus roseus TaxID=4058 RepID=A0ACC0BI19_CATRO|nr:hypothetical protein M9H77_12655 [Catharanthus roseus]